MATIRDVARRAGVSPATVSYVLNHSGPVRPETRERVLRAIAELGYHPHAGARQLKRRRSDTVGLILPTGERRLSDPFFLELIHALGDACADHHLDLLIATCQDPTADLRLIDRLYKGRRVDGFLLIDLQRQDPRIPHLLQAGIPFVAFGRVEGNGEFPWVDVDGAAGMREAVAFLVGKGHRRIAYLSPPLSFTFAYHRFRGYQQGLSEADLPFDGTLVRITRLTMEGGYEAAWALLREGARFTALIAATDLMALGAMRALHEAGRTPGQDVAVIGFDDIPMAAQAHPPLTTLRQPMDQIGRALVRAWLAAVNGESLPPTLIPPTLIRRESA
ncbi:LacI family DNA-binding transcriptional regulator [Thermoflexus sp.]|uniref:LacI family DNA-binding transcriptional regulator n=1 Tax=Thermoflexus sp. TaxID=1969742 RepID=UPI0035E3FBF6